MRSLPAFYDQMSVVATPRCSSTGRCSSESEVARKAGPSAPLKSAALRMTGLWGGERKAKTKAQANANADANARTKAGPSAPLKSTALQDDSVRVCLACGCQIRNGIAFHVDSSIMPVHERTQPSA